MFSTNKSKKNSLLLSWICKKKHSYYFNCIFLKMKWNTFPTISKTSLLAQWQRTTIISFRLLSVHLILRTNVKVNCVIKKIPSNQYGTDGHSTQCWHCARQWVYNEVDTVCTVYLSTTGWVGTHKTFGLYCTIVFICPQLGEWKQKKIFGLLYYFLFRVSIPRSTLMSPHHVKPQRRSQYEPSDSFALSKVGNKWCYYTLDIPRYLPIEIWKLESFKNL